jgi:hypothetical protein
MSIRTIIKAAVESIADAPTFMWGIPSDFNERLDDKSGERFALMLPYESEITEGQRMQMNLIPLTHTISIGVVKRTAFTLEYDTARAEVLEEMHTLAQEILGRVFVAIQSLRNAKIEAAYFTELKRFGMDGLGAYFNQFDINADGIQLTIIISEKVESPVCFDGANKVVI